MPNAPATPEPATRPVEQKPFLVLRPPRGWGFPDFRELWQYRELLYFLTWRDIKVRYKQTLLGVSWAILQPFISMVVFSIFFGRLAKMPSDGVPYPIFSYAGLLPWDFFAKAFNKASRSLVASRPMLTKVYFPRLVIPLAAVLGAVVDFALAFSVLAGLMAWYGVRPTPQLWTLPFFLLLAFVVALGASLWASALNVLYRDVGYVLPFLVNLLFFITPVVYAPSMVPERWRLIYALNPMAGVVNGFRWALLGTPTGPDVGMLLSIAVALLVLITGLLFFRYMERYFADRV
ncbi:MAG: ABC transporter permease [Chloroflexi bacterium]|nr:ABC transporter permease [Chloroflexota bacterium]